MVEKKGFTEDFYLLVAASMGREMKWVVRFFDRERKRHQQKKIKGVVKIWEWSFITATMKLNNERKRK